MAHNYAINDDVHHQLQGPQGRAVVKQRSIYTIVTCLPIEADGRPRYRIKSKTENIERVRDRGTDQPARLIRSVRDFGLTKAEVDRDRSRRRFMSLRRQHRMDQSGAGEFLEPHGLAEQIALHQVEPHFIRGNEIGPGLDSLGDDPDAIALGEFDDAAADRLFQPVVGAARDELSIDLEFGEGECFEPHQRRPVGSDIVDRNRDVAKPHFPGDIDHHVQIVDHLGCF